MNRISIIKIPRRPAGDYFCPIRQQSKRKEGLAMEFKVRLFLGDELIDPSDYDKIRINCPDVDRIVN